MDLLRVYFLAGLVAHKAVWEYMKVGRVVRKTATPPGVLLVKIAKLGILAAILAQCLVGDVLPISQDPFALRVWGGALFTVGLAVALAGRIQLGDNWLDIESAGVKHRQGVTTNGVYRFIRHPIYAGDLALLIGLELGLNSWLVTLAVLLAPVVVRQTMREESMLSGSLPGYRDYCRRTKRFIPFLA